MAQPEPSSTPIRGALLAGPANRRAGPKDVLVADGVIREAGQGVAFPEGARVVGTAGSLIHSGLVHARLRGRGGLARGQGDKWTLEPLFAASPWIGCGRSPQDKKLTALICAAVAPTVIDRTVHEAIPGFAGP